MLMILQEYSKLFEYSPTKKNFKKSIDKLKNLWYNKYVIKRDYKIKKMKEVMKNGSRKNEDFNKQGKGRQKNNRTQ